MSYPGSSGLENEALMKEMQSLQDYNSQFVESKINNEANRKSSKAISGFTENLSLSAVKIKPATKVGQVEFKVLPAKVHKMASTDAKSPP